MAASCSAEARGAATATSFNFSAAAGPLPAPVIEEVAAACRDWRGQGSVLSLPFTSETGAALMPETSALLREILVIPNSHDILFLQGGASAQFGLVPLNLLGDKIEAAYLASGHWSRRAIAEAQKHCEVHVVSDPAAPLDPARCAYLHLTSNETADGLQLHELPEATVPLVADMTSDFLTRRVDWSRVDLAYAAMQKCIGVAGLTVVVVRRDLLGRARPGLPPVFDYTAQAAAGSRVNTPPVFAIFVTRAMLAWIADQGGLAAVEAVIARRSARVYEVLDRHPETFHVPVPHQHRSRTSLCFGVPEPGGNEACIAAAQAHGILGLAGHPQAGGLRAAIYAGTSEAAVDRLCEFLDDFAGHGTHM